MLRVKEAFELERQRAGGRHEWPNATDQGLWGHEPARASNGSGAVRFCIVCVSFNSFRTVSPGGYFPHGLRWICQA